MSRQEPLAYEGLTDRFLAECEFHGRENRKLRFALLAVGALHGGVEPDLIAEVTWSQTDDFWYYALCAFVAWTRAAAERAGLSVRDVCERLADDHNLDLGSRTPEGGPAGPFFLAHQRRPAVLVSPGCA